MLSSKRRERLFGRLRRSLPRSLRRRLFDDLKGRQQLVLSKLKQSRTLPTKLARSRRPRSSTQLTVERLSLLNLVKRFK